MTVGDLRRWLESCPDDAPVVAILDVTEPITLNEAYPAVDEGVRTYVLQFTSRE